MAPGGNDWSYGLLAPDERELFDSLAVFAGDFDVAAVAAVGGVDEFEALDLLEQLVDKSMVEADPTKDRYRLLETLRQYGWDRLAAADRLGAVRDAHATHYASVVGDRSSRCAPRATRSAALDRLDADYDNLRAALAHLIDSRQADAAARLVRRLVGLFNVRHPREGLGWFEAVVAIADELPPRVQARLMVDAAHAAMNAGDLRSELAYAQREREVGGAEVRALGHTFIADWHLWNNDPQSALEHLDQARAATADALSAMMFGPMLIQASSAFGDEAETRRHLAALISQAETFADPTFLAASLQIAGQGLATPVRRSPPGCCTGQVLASTATAAIVGTAKLLDLGEHRLRDLSGSERIFQLGAAVFPPIRSEYESEQSAVGADRVLRAPRTARRDR